MGANCYSTTHADSGCSIEVRGHGHKFLSVWFQQCGGWYICTSLGQLRHVHVALRSRADIPADLIAERSSPSTWALQPDSGSSHTCDITTNFYDHKMIIDATICGNWAGSHAYVRTTICPGTCSDMVANATQVYADEMGHPLPSTSIIRLHYH